MARAPTRSSGARPAVKEDKLVGVGEEGSEAASEVALEVGAVARARPAPAISAVGARRSLEARAREALPVEVPLPEALPAEVATREALLPAARAAVEQASAERLLAAKAVAPGPAAARPAAKRWARPT